VKALKSSMLILFFPGCFFGPIHKEEDLVPNSTEDNLDNLCKQTEISSNI